MNLQNVNFISGFRLAILIFVAAPGLVFSDGTNKLEVSKSLDRLSVNAVLLDRNGVSLSSVEAISASSIYYYDFEISGSHQSEKLEIYRLRREAALVVEVADSSGSDRRYFQPDAKEAFMKDIPEATYHAWQGSNRILQTELSSTTNGWNKLISTSKTNHLDTYISIPRKDESVLAAFKIPAIAQSPKPIGWVRLVAGAGQGTKNLNPKLQFGMPRSDGESRSLKELLSLRASPSPEAVPFINDERVVTFHFVIIFRAGNGTNSVWSQQVDLTQKINFSK